MAVRKAATSRAVSAKPANQPPVIEGEVIDGETEEDASEIIEECMIGNLKVRIRRATEDQIMVLMKHARLAEKARTREASLRLNEVFFRLVEKLVVDPADIDLLDDGLTDRTVTVQQIAIAMRATDDKEADGPETPAVRTRRGR